MLEAIILHKTGEKGETAAKWRGCNGKGRIFSKEYRKELMSMEEGNRMRLEE